MGEGSGDLRRAITATWRRDETECVAELLGQLDFSPEARAAIDAEARRLAAGVRARRAGASGVDQLMHEFSLSSQEGVALMCLAEALLRIPDADTADRLIRDKVAGGDWRSHLGHSASLFVNAAAWGLMVTGRLMAVAAEDELESALGAVLRRLLTRGGEPLIRRGVDFAMRLVGEQFVLGETIAAAIARGREAEALGYRHSYDMLGEAALTAADAERYAAAYADAIAAIGAAAGGAGPREGAGISVKLSALHPRYVRSQRRRVLAELLPRLKSLALAARRHDIGFNIDAEESERLDLSLDLLEALAGDPQLSGWEGLGFVVQAYQKRAPLVIDWLGLLARRNGRRFMVRLVKGAYWDSEIKRAQVEGQAGYPVYTRKSHTDVAYLACASKLLEAADAFYSQFATHNAHTLAAVQRMAAERGVADLEFQCLHGMGEALYDPLVEAGLPCRIYAPVGSHATLLPYLVRRLLENGANTSFVNRVVDEAVAIDELVADPAAQVRAEGGSPHPRIPLPGDLFAPERRNSAGLDLANEAVLASLESSLTALTGRAWDARPLLAAEAPACPARPVVNPADPEDVVGTVADAGPEAVEAALAAAAAFAPVWAATPAATRAAALERSADALEAARTDLMSLAIREAGKTWGNAAGEVREAADFCRYYAARAREAGASPADPSPLACISPWNFPLAIFVGQAAAALAAGRPVLAKPAEQTPLTAAQAVRILHAACIPKAALQLLPGPGETVGAALVADPRIGGVMFTGSTAVAREINRVLAAREGKPLLIAETGGVNAMIVDSSAQPEQVVQDVLASAFDSAGQRCSALRLLCLQEDVADRLLELLEGAMAELVLGDPADLATDIGPVIDAAAREGLEAYIASRRREGRRVLQLPLPAACRDGHYVPPTLIAVDRPADLPGEVFGPVLHVLRFPARGLTRLVEEINALGYGLTGGLHTRLDTTIAAVADRLKVGNLYVNRNQIGAVVGVQPFGGEGLSGTGPKAGGPLCLPRLLGAVAVPLDARPLLEREPALAPLLALQDWALATGREGLAGLCASYAEMSPAFREMRLPGPTGEANTLRFLPRGPVLCIAADVEDRLAQVAAALAAGNPAWLDSPWPPGLPPAVAVSRALAGTRPAAVLVAGDAGLATSWRRTAAAWEGPLVPVLAASPGLPAYPLHRLVSERVLSVNTAAAGGNATLMAFSP